MQGNYLNPNEYPIITNYCEDLTAKQYITNPAIAREDEIKKTMLVLLTPEKSALLIGKPGIGKTAIVEGIAYKIQRGDKLISGAMADAALEGKQGVQDNAEEAPAQEQAEA